MQYVPLGVRFLVTMMMMPRRALWLCGVTYTRNLAIDLRA